MAVDPNDLALCYPNNLVGCQANADCNRYVDGGPNGDHFACVNGSCHCGNSATDCLNGAVCDTGSGACYLPCSSDAVCGNDTAGNPICCAATGSIHHCDPYGAH